MAKKQQDPVSPPFAFLFSPDRTHSTFPLLPVIDMNGLAERKGGKEEIGYSRYFLVKRKHTLFSFYGIAHRMGCQDMWVIVANVMIGDICDVSKRRFPRTHIRISDLIKKEEECLPRPDYIARTVFVWGEPQCKQPIFMGIHLPTP